MNPADSDNFWRGLRSGARDQLIQRDYSKGIPGGMDFASGKIDIPIPGVEVFERAVHQQRHRGIFGELVKEDEGILAKIGFSPKQWSAARMFAGTAKGFHIHPPFVPEGEDPANWFRRLYLENPGDTSLRPYDREQWDVMFFISGAIEMLLIDEREGMTRNAMQFFIDGDSASGPHKVGVVIPAGVAHALRATGSDDPVMIYGTSTVFVAENEGRIASGVESFPLPEDWEKFSQSS